VFVALKTLLRSLLLPPTGPLLLAVAGAWLLRARATPGARRAGWPLLIAGLASLWLLSTPLVADWLARWSEREAPLDAARATAAQAIVILGGGDERLAAPEYGGAAAPGPVLLERLAYGALLARRTGLPLLVSGSARETAAMRVSLSRDFGLAVRWVEDRSADTFENAQYSASLLRAAGVSRVVLVTSAAHAWRAAHEFESAGFTVLPAPVGLWAERESGWLRYLPSPTALLRSSSALYELLGDPARRVLAATHLRAHRP
jgi:uncharacterized SAM-binding protein YcdF (DUF218 family)